MSGPFGAPDENVWTARVFIDQRDFPIVRECLKRGLNTWQLGPDKEGEVIRKILEAMK